MHFTKITSNYLNRGISWAVTTDTTNKESRPEILVVLREKRGSTIGSSVVVLILSTPLTRIVTPVDDDALPSRLQIGPIRIKAKISSNPRGS